MQRFAVLKSATFRILRVEKKLCVKAPTRSFARDKR
jgi:hypothetical protein